MRISSTAVSVLLLLAVGIPSDTFARGFFFQYGINDAVISETGPPRDASLIPHKQSASIAMGASGVSLVAWVAPDGSASEIYVRPVATSNGAPMLPAVPISSSNVVPAEFETAMACSATRESCLVTWTAIQNFALQGMWGRMVSARTGEPLGASFPIREDDRYLVSSSVAYSSDHDTYLIGGFRGDQVMLTRITGDGVQVDNPERIEVGGLLAGFDFDVAYDSFAERFVIVFTGARSVGGAIDVGIFAAYVDPSANGAVGESALISAMPGVDAQGAALSRPNVEFGAVSGRVLVTWQADDIGATLDGEFEIYGQMIEYDPFTDRVSEIGADDFRISAMNGIGKTLGDATQPDLGYDSSSGTFVVTYAGTDPTPPFSPEGDEFEIYLQTVDDTAAALVSDAQRISDAGGRGDPDYDAIQPVVSVGAGRAHIMWWARDELIGLGFFDRYDEQEFFGQMVNLSGLFRDGFE